MRLPIANYCQVNDSKTCAIIYYEVECSRVSFVRVCVRCCVYGVLCTCACVCVRSPMLSRVVLNALNSGRRKKNNDIEVDKSILIHKTTIAR